MSTVIEMGSDAIKKSARQGSGKRSNNWLVVTLSVILLIVALETTKGKNRNVLKSSIRRSTSLIGRIIPKKNVEGARDKLPQQCWSLLEDLNKCQSSKETVVFGCHRKWCGSYYGHCEEVNGIGDRTQRMLSMATDAIDKCIRIELDYPQSHNGVNLRFPMSMEYIDRYYPISELLHFRSYDVSDQGSVQVEEWGKGVIDKTFAHFTPNNYKWHKYDPCLYHILFETNDELQTDLNYYSDLFHIDQGNVIGIHFRTGDLTAFGVKNKDIRAQGQSLDDSYHKMVSCAESLAKKLQLQPSDQSGKYQFFLATDNQHVKDMAKSDERYDIHMTIEKPSPYLNSSGDRSAYLDLYLLSQTKGLAVNVLPAEYDGPAERVSTFARLAWNIAFMNEDQLYECELG